MTTYDKIWTQFFLLELGLINIVRNFQFPFDTTSPLLPTGTNIIILLSTNKNYQFIKKKELQSGKTNAVIQGYRLV